MSVYEGPVRKKSKDILYTGRKETLPSFMYKYPDGAREVVDEYGGYFGAYWSAGESVDRTASIELFAERVLTTLHEGLCDVIVIEQDSRTELRTEMSHLVATLKETVTETAVRWKVDCHDASFYWEDVPKFGPISGVLTYDGAPHTPLIAWQQATAADSITQRGGYLRDHLPTEDPEVL